MRVAGIAHLTHKPGFAPGLCVYRLVELSRIHAAQVNHLDPTAATVAVAQILRQQRERFPIGESGSAIVTVLIVREGIA